MINGGVSHGWSQSRDNSQVQFLPLPFSSRAGERIDGQKSLQQSF